jgi:hypothetical protein
VARQQASPFGQIVAPHSAQSVCTISVHNQCWLGTPAGVTSAHIAELMIWGSSLLYRTISCQRAGASACRVRDRGPDAPAWIPAQPAIDHPTRSRLLTVHPGLRRGLGLDAYRFSIADLRWLGSRPKAQAFEAPPPPRLAVCPHRLQVRRRWRGTPWAGARWRCVPLAAVC